MSDDDTLTEVLFALNNDSDDDDDEDIPTATVVNTGNYGDKRRTPYTELNQRKRTSTNSPKYLTDEEILDQFDEFFLGLSARGNCIQVASKRAMKCNCLEILEEKTMRDAVSGLH